MSVLHVDLVPKDASGSVLEETYRDTFRPAIRRQPGFRSVGLLRPAEAGQWRLAIEFAREADRIAWVESDTHQRVWGAMEDQLETYQPVLYEEVSAP